ncbi:hypothetical protein ABZZ36_32285 [Actinacidiphila glaucinigra]|uniref:hypothetical protein n=1 Tax=Actinacidiphila glaucinigra TaxID=235986 RepID=UPI0033AAD61E
MNVTTPVQLAGQFADVGNSLLSLAGDWAEKALPIVLLTIAVVTAARKFSLKAGLGALIGLALCMGIYASRDSLSDAFSDEINNPAHGSSPIVSTVSDLPVPPPYQAPGASAGSR